MHFFQDFACSGVAADSENPERALADEQKYLELQIFFKKCRKRPKNDQKWRFLMNFFIL